MKQNPYKVLNNKRLETAAQIVTLTKTKSSLFFIFEINKRLSDEENGITNNVFRVKKMTILFSFNI